MTVTLGQPQVTTQKTFTVLGEQAILLTTDDTDIVVEEVPETPHTTDEAKPQLVTATIKLDEVLSQPQITEAVVPHEIEETLLIVDTESVAPITVSTVDDVKMVDTPTESHALPQAAPDVTEEPGRMSPEQSHILVPTDTEVRTERATFEMPIESAAKPQELVLSFEVSSEGVGAPITKIVAPEDVPSQVEKAEIFVRRETRTTEMREEVPLDQVSEAAEAPDTMDTLTQEEPSLVTQTVHIETPTQQRVSEQQDIPESFTEGLEIQTGRTIKPKEVSLVISQAGIEAIPTQAGEQEAEFPSESTSPVSVTAAESFLIDQTVEGTVTMADVEQPRETLTHTQITQLISSETAPQPDVTFDLPSVAEILSDLDTATPQQITSAVGEVQVQVQLGQTETVTEITTVTVDGVEQVTTTQRPQVEHSPQFKIEEVSEGTAGDEVSEPLVEEPQEVSPQVCEEPVQTTASTVHIEEVLSPLTSPDVSEKPVVDETFTQEIVIKPQQKPRELSEVAMEIVPETHTSETLVIMTREEPVEDKPTEASELLIDVVAPEQTVTSVITVDNEKPTEEITLVEGKRETTMLTFDIQGKEPEPRELTFTVSVPEEEKVEVEQIEIERVDIEERVDTEQVVIERVDTERVDIERVDTERVDTERVDIERVDTERVDIERVDTETREDVVEVEETTEERERIESEEKVDHEESHSEEIVIQVPERGINSGMTDNGMGNAHI